MVGRQSPPNGVVCEAKKVNGDHSGVLLASRKHLEGKLLSGAREGRRGRRRLRGGKGRGPKFTLMRSFALALRPFWPYGRFGPMTVLALWPFWPYGRFGLVAVLALLLSWPYDRFGSF